MGLLNLNWHLVSFSWSFVDAGVQVGDINAWFWSEFHSSHQSQMDSRQLQTHRTWRRFSASFASVSTLSLVGCWCSGCCSAAATCPVVAVGALAAVATCDTSPSHACTKQHILNSHQSRWGCTGGGTDCIREDPNEEGDAEAVRLPHELGLSWPSWSILEHRDLFYDDRYHAVSWPRSSTLRWSGILSVQVRKLIYPHRATRNSKFWWIGEIRHIGTLLASKPQLKPELRPAATLIYSCCQY